MHTVSMLAKRVLLPAAILLLGSLLFTYFYVTRPQARPNPPQERAWPVHVLTAHYEDLQPELTVFGEVVAGRQAEIRSMVAGRIVELNPEFKDGAVADAGTPVARIDAFEYEIAVQERSAELTEAQARLHELQDEIEAERALLAAVSEQLDLRRRDLERTANLKSKGQASEKAQDDAALAVNATIQTRLERQQAIGRLIARISQQEAVIEKNRAALERAKRDLSYTEISVPFTGYVSDVEAAIGKRVAVGESLARLIDASNLEVRFELPDADFARLIAGGDRGAPHAQTGLQGLPVDVIWQVGERAFTYHARVMRTDAEIDPATGGIGVYAVIATNGPDSVLRPGAFVEVLVPDVRYEGVIAVPESAVSGDGVVYVVEDDRLAARRVEVLREFGDQVYIRGKVAEGARIVARQFPDIGPGLKVRIPTGASL